MIIHNYKHPPLKELCEIFGVSMVWAINKRVRNFRDEIEDLQRQKGIAIKHIIQDGWSLYEPAKIDKQIMKIEKTVKWLNKIKKVKDDVEFQEVMSRGVDLSVIKDIPIDEVLDRYNRRYDKNRFFKLRPEETTASAQFNVEKTLFCDRGNSNEGGSVVDLMMVLEKCSVGEAIKKLTYIL